MASRSRERAWARPLARSLVSLVFIGAGLGKLAAFESSLRALESAGLPASALLLWGAIAVEVVGGLLLLVGLAERGVATTLLLYLLPVTLLFHLDPGSRDQVAQLLKNLAILGGLLEIAFGREAPAAGTSRDELPDLSPDPSGVPQFPAIPPGEERIDDRRSA